MHAAPGLTLREHEAAKRIAGVEVSSIDFDDNAGMGDQYCGLHFTVSRGDVGIVDAIACHPNVFRADLYAQAFKAIDRGLATMY